MTKHYNFANIPSTTPPTPIDWSAIQPLRIAEQQWIVLEQPPEAEVRGVYDAEALSLQFRVFEAAPQIQHRHHGDPVYEDSCVEFFWQPMPHQDPRYFNFELNAAGVLLLAIGVDRYERQPITPDEARRFDIHASIGLFDRTSARTYWELSYRIPFSFVRQHFPEYNPVPGTAMKGNFYKCGDRTPAPHYLSWNRIDSEVPNYHLRDSFGTLILA